MRTLYIRFVLVLIIAASCLTQSWAFELMPSSARALALGNAAAALPGGFGDVLAANPAQLTLALPGVNLFQTNKFAIPGFEERSVSFSWKTGKVFWGAMYLRDSALLYEENQGGVNENDWVNSKLGLGLAYKLSEEIGLGFGLWSHTYNVNVVSNPESAAGTESYCFSNVGMNYDRKTFGVASVIEGIRLNEISQIKLALRLGELGKLMALGEVKIELAEKCLNYYAGLEAPLAPNFILRAGLDQAGSFTSGIGVGKGRWNVDYTYKLHKAGNTHYLSSGYQF